MTATSTLPSPARTRPDRVGWAALLVVWVVWGSTYLAIRVGVRSMPPFTLAAVRYLIAGAVLLPLGLRSGPPALRAADRPAGRQWAAMLLLGAMLPAAGNGVISWAEVKLPSSVAALLVGTVPLWMLLADGLLRRRMPGPTRWAAIAAGVVGVSVLSGGGGGAIPLGATLAALGAAASWGVGSVLQGRLPVPARPLLLAGMEMLCGGAVLAVVAAVRGELVFDLSSVTAQSWWALIYLIGPGSLLGLTCYLFVLGRLSASTASSYAFVNPVVAVVLGALLLDEHLSVRQALGGALVVLAVAGLLAAPRRPRRPVADPPAASG